MANKIKVSIFQIISIQSNQSPHSNSQETFIISKCNDSRQHRSKMVHDLKFKGIHSCQGQTRKGTD